MLRRQKGGGPEWDEALIPLTVPEVRRLLYRLIWRPMPLHKSVLAWSRWRRRHQARARHCHYQRRLQHLQPISAAVVLNQSQGGMCICLAVGIGP